MYLGEEGGPDGLNVRDLGGSDEGLELLGLVVITKIISAIVLGVKGGVGVHLIQ